MEDDNAVAHLLAQREAVVSFGRKALQSSDMQAVLTEACRLTGKALGTDLAKVMQLIDGGHSLRVIAGVGWQNGVVGEETVPAIDQSSEGYALKTGVPAVSPDVSKEDRFDYAGFLKRHGVQAIVNVVIPGPVGESPFGLLQVDSREPREFSESDIKFLQGYANIIGAAIERHRYQEQLRNALDTQTRLHAELLHRIKNNLAVISSILRVKSRQSAHPVVQQEISDVLSRIEVLAQIYDQLHSSSQSERIDLGGYLSALCTRVVSFTNQIRDRAKISTDAEVALVETAVAVPLGLVLTEFVTNSLKHAGTARPLKIDLSINRKPKEIEIRMSDNGPGFGDGLERKEEKNSGSGILLMEGLLRQANANWKWDSENGARLTVLVPIVETLSTETVHD